MATESSPVRIEDLMTDKVMCVTRQQSVGHVRSLMKQHGVHSFPVADGDGKPIGIVTATDFLRDRSDETLVGEVMTRKTYTVPRYSAPDLAARIMRNHKIHHVIVTDEQKVVGVLSSFDLLKLVENKRFVAKNQPSRPRAGRGKRRTQEEGSVE